jgi:hypothetical protein
MRIDIPGCLKEGAKLSIPMKKRWGGFVFFLIVVFIFWPAHSAKAEDNAADREGKQRLEEIEEIEKKEEEGERRGILNPIVQDIFGEKVWLNGTLELNYEYLDTKDVDNENSGSSNDFFVSTAELALGVIFNEWSKAKVVVAAEDVIKNGDDEEIRLDEAIATLKSLHVPLYVIGGKTVMPFGFFEDHLIDGTLAEDLYEIEEWGATLGFNPDFYGLDVSFSVYRNAQIADQLNDFDTHEFRRGRQREDKFRSYIANVTLEPVEDTLTLGAFYNSEPGDGRRNRSIGGAFTLDHGKFTLDAEYVTALSREDGENEEENKESATVVGLAFEPLEALQLVTRYAVFNDDDPGDQDEVLDYRVVAGFNYSLLELVDVRFLTEATLLFEYRHSKFEKEEDTEATNSQNMYQFQLVLGF